MHNAELIRMVETLKAKRTIKKDVDIVASTGFSKTVVSNYLSGRIKASDNFLDKFEKVYGVDIFNKNGLSKDIEITTSLHAELGRINEILIRLFIYGNKNYNHHSSFQSLFNYSSTGTMDNYFG